MNDVSQGTTADLSMELTLSADGNHNITVVTHDKAGYMNSNTIEVTGYSPTTLPTSTLPTSTPPTSTPPTSTLPTSTQTTSTSSPGFLLITLISGFLVMYLVKTDKREG